MFAAILGIFGCFLLVASLTCLFGFMDGYDRYEHTCTPTAKNWGIAAAILFSLFMLFMMLYLISI